MTVALLQLSKHNRPYKNPFRLQVLGREIQNRFPACRILFYDVDANHPISSMEVDYAVIDTTETNILDTAEILKVWKIRNLFLFGDVVDYGEAEEAKQFLEACYTSTKVYLSTEAELPKDLETHGLHKATTIEALTLPDGPIQIASKERSLQYMAEGVSDGCEMRCSFCRHSCGDRSVRCFSSPSLPDLPALRALCPEPIFVQFSDENYFGLSEPRLVKVLELAEELKELEGDFRFGVDTRIDSVFPPSSTPPNLTALHHACWQEMLKAGLRYCFLGVESFSLNQLVRYNKNNNLARIPDCIRFFEEHRLEYTLGLILWDPLMTKEDLLVNLSTIRSLGLLGHTASLWKPLRIPIKSQYRKHYLPEAGCKSEHDFFLLKEDISSFQDRKIREMARYVFPLYHLFDNCGYRHSDVSSFSVLLEERDPVFLKQIPRLIANLEITVLEDLLNLTEVELSPPHSAAYYNLCLQACQEVVEGLNNSCANCSVNAQKIVRYYDDVFTKIINCISQHSGRME